MANKTELCWKCGFGTKQYKYVPHIKTGYDFISTWLSE